MKMIAILILVVGLTASYAETDAQTTRLNLNFTNGTVKDVLEEIEHQTNLSFMYDNDVFKVNRQISIEAENETLKSVVEKLISGENLKYEMVNRYIVITSAKEPPANQQGNKVTGKVADSNGGSLPGVSVVVKGTTTGVTTDNNGSYSLSNIPENATLQFSFVGMKTQEIKIGTQTSINVVLADEAIGIEEVVAIGYGTMKKSDLTGSITSVSSNDYKSQPVTNPGEILKGRAAGVSVTTLSGAPGGDFKIRIRGANSILGGNDPLLVVDGIQGGISLNDINPNDIESMDILKDASSTAIYGSRGANGVILVTTKSGSTGAAKVELNTFYSLKTARDPFEVMDPVLYAETVNLSTGGTAYSSSDIEKLRRNGGSHAYKDLLQQGLIKNYEVSARGGSKLAKYSLSAGIQNEDGVLINTKLKKYMFRSNISTQLSDKITVGLNLNATQTVGHNISSSYDETGAAHNWGPAESIKNPDGSWQMSDPYGYYLTNPVMLLNEMNRDNVSTIGVIGTNLKYDILKGLTFQSIGGLNMNYWNGAYCNNELFALSPSVGGKTGSGQSSGTSSYWQLSNTLTYSKTINADHRFTVMTGIEASEGKYKGFNADGTDMATTSVGYYNLSMNTTKTIGSAYSSSTLNSYLARATYNYKDRYLLTGTYRADGSSKFKGNNRYSYFPSLGLGWRLSEEDFIHNMNVFDNLKLRASWGKTGNQAIGAYGTLSLLTQSDYSYGTNSNFPGYKPQGSSNPDLKWEVTTQTDMGLDVAVLDNRLSVSLDMYKKSTSGLLQAVAIPNYNGGGTVTQNIGVIENKGFEITVNTVPVKNRDWKWDANLNISYAKNEVISVGDENMIFPGVSYGGSSQKWFVVMPGQPLGTFYGLKWLGIWHAAESAEAAKYGAKSGDNKFEDINKDFSIDGKDNQVIGHGVSPWRMGFNTTISYKDFSLNAFIEAATGGQTYNYNYSMMAVMTSEGRTVTAADGADYWSPSNDGAKFANILSDTYNAFRNNSQWLQDGSFIKFRNISLSYNLPKQKTRFADIKLFLSGQNLLTVTKYKGDDPEASSTGGSDTDTGLDRGVYPSVKTYTAGVTIIF